MRKIRAFLGDREGVTAIEYALIAGLIAVVAFGAMKSVGTSLSNLFSTIATSISDAPGTGSTAG
ncbi:Flp family type IVb pilin [Acetobacter sp. LMG 1636]|uniref:Flp family type IVb pilin n=2 Tax=Acetobacter fallax TaxID=1737473 RepID=A0ABX0KET1_9PROT|nr:Flp family type IVb pilin [Acetobacter fallax]NHO37208.1 Flp family type IVb pilin [Acetobacter fallax]